MENQLQARRREQTLLALEFRAQVVSGIDTYDRAHAALECARDYGSLVGMKLVGMLAGEEPRIVITASDGAWLDQYARKAS